jgi:hypothetical protein
VADAKGSGLPKLNVDALGAGGLSPLGWFRRAVLSQAHWNDLRNGRTNMTSLPKPESAVPGHGNRPSPARAFQCCGLLLLFAVPFFFADAADQ